VHTLPSERVVNPLDRFLRQQEIRVEARVDLENMTFASLGGDERERGPENFSGREWTSMDSSLSSLEGHSALRGLAQSVMKDFGAAFPATALRDVLLFIAPGLIQCLAARAHRVLESGGAAGAPGPSIQQLGGLPDSCYIWRAGGPGQERRQGAPTFKGSEE